MNINSYLKIINPKIKEAQSVINNIMSGKENDDQIILFLNTLSNRGEKEEEIIGAAFALLENANKIKSPDEAIDIVGTGGDCLNTYNISTTVMFVVSACGVAVSKHGNKAVSSKSGASNILDELGININKNIKEVEKQLEQIKIAFLMAPLYHPCMKHVANARALLKKKTLFNYLGPLVNPSGVKKYLLGVSDKKYQEIMVKALIKLGATNFWVVNAENNMDELSTTCPTNVTEYKNGKIKSFTLDCTDFGIKTANIKDIEGKDPKHNAKELLELLQGKQSAYFDMVIYNSAAALLITEKAKNLNEGIELAKNAILSGKALQKFHQLKSY